VQDFATIHSISLQLNGRNCGNLVSNIYIYIYILIYIYIHMNMTHSACLLPVQTIHTCRACFCFKKAGGQVQKKIIRCFIHPALSATLGVGGFRVNLRGGPGRRYRSTSLSQNGSRRIWHIPLLFCQFRLSIPAGHVSAQNGRRPSSKEISPLFHPPDFDQTWRPSGIAPIHSFTSESGDDWTQLLSRTGQDLQNIWQGSTRLVGIRFCQLCAPYSIGSTH
jgi:hypothetical protein